MIQKFNRKADFMMIMEMRANKLFGTLEKIWNCNSRTYLWYINHRSNIPSKVKCITFLGFSSDTFSDRGEGLVFSDSNMKEIEKEYPFIARSIEAYRSNRQSLYEFKIY
jgi:hypothetical protein